MTASSKSLAILSIAVIFSPVTSRTADLPAPVVFDAGPFGPLELSGGADAFGYALTGVGNQTNPGLLNTSQAAGLQFMNGLVQIQKPDGMWRFAVQAGAVNSFVLGTKPTYPSLQTFSTGPVRAAYLTFAPTNDFSVSAGQIGSLEGFESGVDWENYNVLNSALFYTENSQSVGVRANYAYGNLSGSAIFSDGFDTNHWSYLQLKASYAFDSSNNLTLYGATNLGTTGLNARFYGNATTPSWQTTVQSAGVANLVNSSVLGAYYTFTSGNLTLVPELQYVWSKPNAEVGLTEYSDMFGAALFANYKFSDSPFSLGGWAQYFSSNGPDFWYLNPGAKGFGLVIGPTWTPPQAKNHLFVRGDVGFTHLTSVGVQGSVAYGSSGTEPNQATFVLEAGVLF